MPISSTLKRSAHGDAAGQRSLKRTRLEHQAAINVFRFLDLPGEIRNEIYSYLVPHNDTMIKPKKRTRRSTQASSSNQGSLSLAHACRQLRWEFFALWAEQLPAIHGQDFARFTQDFVIHGPLADFNASMAVIVPTTNRHPAVDFLPAVKFWRDNADAAIGMEIAFLRDQLIGPYFKEDVAGPIQMAVVTMWALVTAHFECGAKEKERWGRFFDEAVLAVLLVWENGPKIKLVVKRKYEEWWMGGAWLMRSNSTTEWFRKHGLTLTCTWLAKVVISAVTTATPPEPLPTAVAPPLHHVAYPPALEHGCQHAAAPPSLRSLATTPPATTSVMVAWHPWAARPRTKAVDGPAERGAHQRMSLGAQSAAAQDGAPNVDDCYIGHVAKGHRPPPLASEAPPEPTALSRPDGPRTAHRCLRMQHPRIRAPYIREGRGFGGEEGQTLE
ncbi:hypothetical protein OPT61_g4538 [Boeremia exigua]|uniref:Uncharacterized protein n=1 Tax=Boeremia exigua TaxID=749465 RepID=A0ACC2IDS0_9PLEO|nr:hypothetical protein OPT61_g4538 [Boeremia exigua]